MTNYFRIPLLASCAASMPRENNPRAISSEINHEKKKKRRNGNNRKRENERSCGPSKNNAARSIVSSLRFFRSILLRFPIVFFFLSIPFLEFFHDECEKTTQEYNENCLGFLDRLKITILAYLFPLLYNIDGVVESVRVGSRGW